MTYPSVITIILNTNRKVDTLACLVSLQDSTYPNLRTIVLDNGSTDGSIDAIQAEFPEVEIIEIEYNRGYAGNNNVGIQAAIERDADWIYVLNEDTILASDCIEQLVRQGMQNTKTGIIGPLVYHYDEPNVIQSAGASLGRFWESEHLNQNVTDQGQCIDPVEVDWVSGCAIMVRKNMVKQIGMLDERFFYYWEETEWCLRARRHNWHVVFVPSAKLWHKGVQRNYSPGPSVTYYNTRNRFLMMSKHRAPALVWGMAGFQVARTLASWSLKPQWRGMSEHRDAMLQGTTDFLRRRWGMRRTQNTPAQ